MKSLVGVYIKDVDKLHFNGDKAYYEFILIFPNKRRSYYLKSQAEKDKWIAAVKKATGFA